MDTIGSLALHGVKRFVLLNGHGGNKNIANLVIQVAKREYGVMVVTPDGPSNTEVARRISQRRKRYWDNHSGPTETETGLLLFPDLVEMERLEGWKPTLDIHPKLMDYLNPDREDYELVSQVYQACVEPYTDDFTSSGVYGLNDPRDADVEEGRQRFTERARFLVNFVNTWKTIPLPDAYKD
jgi:creatinine amidohydrolase/Fe(II)-dependent formamide hydrolase-like protein